MAGRHDDLETYIAQRAERAPSFPELVDRAVRRRELLRTLAADRRKSGLTRTAVAARMGTSESAVARIETGEADVKLSTLARYAAAVGKRINWTIVAEKSQRA